MTVPRNQVKAMTMRAEAEQVEEFIKQLDAKILTSGDNSKTIWLDVNAISEHVLEELTKRYQKTGWIVEIFPGSNGKTQFQLK